MNILRILLFPIACIYGMIVSIRNLLFSLRILPSKKFHIPVIGIGNLSVGGSGKTPHTEYIARLLYENFWVAIISRGYGRKTSGFIIADKNSTADQIGDEPLQFYQKMPELTIAVDEKRTRGITKLLETNPYTEVVILDDCFQHRYVKPGLSIVLSEYGNLFTSDFMLPTGRLREPRQGINRADILVVTKTPEIFNPIERRLIMKQLAKYRIKKVFFSFIRYGKLEPIREITDCSTPERLKSVILFTGIANSVPLEEYLKRLSQNLIVIPFKDHHFFTENDMIKVKHEFESHFSGNKIIITTEKDYMRLKDKTELEVLKGLPVFYIPIEIDFHEKDKQRFDEIVLDYVTKMAPERKLEIPKFIKPKPIPKKIN